MDNKKGFTLVELLAVIIILSLLALLTSTAVTKLLKDSKEDLYKNQIELIKSSAEAWGADNIYKLPAVGECKYLTVENLKQYGILDADVKDPRTNEQIPNDLKVKIISTAGKYGNVVTSYEVNPTSVSECTRAIVPLVEATTQTTKTTGNVPTGLFNPGDEYIVNVNENNSYHFFVLSVENDKINLIMNRNICADGTLATKENKCFIRWYLSSGSSYGPVTAFDALKSATNNWRNVSNMSINYIDEGDTYGSIITENGITSITKKDGTVTGTYNDLKARLPKKSELESVGCTETNGSCPKWVLDNLNVSSFVTGTTNIEGISGYWTLSSSSSFYAWDIYSSGKFDKNYAYAVANGIRPVISISKNQF